MNSNKANKRLHLEDTICVRISKDTKQRLDQYAKKEKRSVAQATRLIIEGAISKKRKNKTRTRASAALANR